MDSSFAELTHAVPAHGFSSLGGAVTAGVGDETGVSRSVTTVATAADRGRCSAPSSATGGNGGNKDSPGATVVTPLAATPSVVTTTTTTTPLATAPAALTSRSGSGFFSSMHARPPAPAPAPVAATTTATTNAAPPPSQAPQAIQAFQAFHSSSTPFLSLSQTHDFNFDPPKSRPPITRHRTVHAHRQSNSSSKLPAYRFADLHKEPIALPSLLQHRQHNRIPPSPVSPDLDQRPETLPNTDNQFSPPRAPETETGTPSSRKRKSSDVDDVVSRPPLSSQLDALNSRASTFQPDSASQPTATSSSAHLKQSASLGTASAPLSTAGVKSTSVSFETTVTALKRRAPASTSPITPSGQDADADAGGASAEATTRRSSSGQRELLLPKSLQRTASDDRRVSISRKPPLSYKPRTSTGGSASAASIPPIRSFRSSGERRSLVIDMNFRSSRTHDSGDDNGDSNHRDRTLRALEGRRGEDIMQWTPPDSAGERPDGDDTGDLFLKIAREDPSQRSSDGSKIYHTDNSNIISRVARSARRPLSVAISPYQSPSYRSPSPPRMSRRMSEQESRVRGLNYEQGERTGPPVSYRGHSREPHSEDFKFRGANTSTSVRASPLTPRTLTYQDSSDPSSAQRRRQHSIDRSSAVLSRAATLKQANVNYSHPRAYNSSPLVPQPTEAQKTDVQPNGGTPVEGTDSTTSTAAPSTVWDELEELKSRIHRLELTGKLPPTSSAAISRVSDERPPTAHTNATTLSSSPKRGTSSSIVQSIETTVAPKDSHPLLNSALAKSKEFLVPEVYDALEAATIDALTLAAMMGTAGQPGPISSGNSNIGSSSGAVTDRQLRKKADSVCRSLTELCLALSEDAGAAKHQQITAPPPADTLVTSPTITQFSGITTQRRPSVPANRAVELPMSPRAASRYEEKRATILTASALPSPRQNSNVPTTADATSATSAGRKSSLLFSRTRRAGTEEPEDGRRTSTLLRSRRAGTEEPEDLLDRKPILSRGRRATFDNGDDDRLRTPSRAVTEVNGSRPREYISHLPPPPITREADTLANSALPRRRLVGSTTINTRLAQPATVSTPQTPSAIITPNRRYADRTTPGREVTFEVDVTGGDRPQRQFSLARSGSMNRRATNRQSMIATPSNTTTSYYR